MALSKSWFSHFRADTHVFLHILQTRPYLTQITIWALQKEALWLSFQTLLSILKSKSFLRRYGQNENTILWEKYFLKFQKFRVSYLTFLCIIFSNFFFQKSKNLKKILLAKNDPRPKLGGFRPENGVVAIFSNSTFFYFFLEGKNRFRPLRPNF